MQTVYSVPAPDAVIAAPAYGMGSLETVAPELYASLAATVTATTGDPSVPVVVRPATTGQALDASGMPINLAGLSAAGTAPVVDWNAARAGAPYPVETPGQPGVMTYVVPIQVPVYADGAGQIAQTAPLPPQATPFVSPPAAFLPPGAPAPAATPANPFANIIAVTPGAQPVVPTATAGAGLAGGGGVFYYGTNPVSIASAIGMETADGTEYLDFGAVSAGAINLITPAQVKQAMARQTPLLIIDVRGDLVREIEGHVPGDINIPFDTPQAFAARVAQAVPDRNLPVIVYCQTGVWSSHAADVLLAMGYKTFLMGAYELWKNAL
jgi:rhodanese-related sulfurtransferase